MDLATLTLEKIDKNAHESNHFRNSILKSFYKLLLFGLKSHILDNHMDEYIYRNCWYLDEYLTLDNFTHENIV